MCTAQSYSAAAHSPNTAGLATKTDLSAADNVPQPTPPASVQNNTHHQHGVCSKVLHPSCRSAPADHVAGYAHLPPHRWTTLYHGCARSSASGRSHMRVLPPGTLCPTTSAPWLILPSSGNCLNHTISVKLLIFVDFCVFLSILAFG